MKHRSVRNGLLAAVAMAAWALYILACTSFSPDDKKVLYPAFDAQSGATGIWVYNRELGKSDLLFLPLLADQLGQAEPEPIALRAQWMSNGKSVLVAWPGTPDNQDADGLNLALIPVEGRGPTKLFFVPDIDDAVMRLSWPLALAGSRLLLQGPDPSNRLARINLDTGEVTVQPCQGDIILYPSPKGDHVLYLHEKIGETGDRKTEFGRMNPDTFAPTPLFEFDDFESEDGFLAFGPDGKSVATLVKDEGMLHLFIRRQGQPDLTRALGLKANSLNFGSAAFSPNGEVIYATYRSVDQEKQTASYGLMEIPVASRPIRRTTLVQEAKPGQGENVLYLQLGLSHDGKTAALASTYLALDDETMRREDCALFLVDLSAPERTVTRVPIPLPRRAKSSNQ